AMHPSQDPVVLTAREQIGAVDAEILDAVNRRVSLVAELHAHKRAQGYPMVDTERERRLIASLAESNPGPLSGQRLEQLYRVLLEICTAEAARLGEQTSASQ
ncbi:MAG TPA: chorismate mutase, partial [Gaiellales bacterium]|nr:chorismate mutase [Gaiellales bacterium]